MKIKKCPWCGASGSLMFIDLGGPRGTGYPGNFEYVVRCISCGAEPPHGHIDDIYRSPEQAKQQAIEKWNRRNKL